MAQNSEPNPEGSESNNVVLFRTAVTNCFKSVAESVSAEEFADTMTILKSNPSVAGKLHKAMVKELYDSMCADLDDVLAEGSLSSGLAKVAKLVREASNRPDEIAWRPPGDVREHLRSLDAAVIKEESEKLEKQVEQMEAENERLMKEVTDKRSRIRMIEEKVNRASRVCAAAIPRAERTIKQLRSMAESLDTPDGGGGEEAIKFRPFE